MAQRSRRARARRGCSVNADWWIVFAVVLLAWSMFLALDAAHEACREDDDV
jgi:hypothetical protein